MPHLEQQHQSSRLFTMTADVRDYDIAVMVADATANWLFYKRNNKQNKTYKIEEQQLASS